MHSFSGLRHFHEPYESIRPWALYLLSPVYKVGLMTPLVKKEEGQETFACPGTGSRDELSELKLEGVLYHQSSAQGGPARRGQDLFSHCSVSNVLAPNLHFPAEDSSRGDAGAGRGRTQPLPWSHLPSTVKGDFQDTPGTKFKVTAALLC